MKRFIIILFVILLCIPLGAHTEELFVVPDFSCMGDILRLNEDETTYCTDDYYAVAVDFSGLYVRYAADLPAEVHVNLSDSNTYYDLVCDLPVSQTEVFKLSPIPQESLDSLLGKTYKELVDIGFEYVSSGEVYEKNRIVFYMAYDVFEYEVFMDTDLETYDRCSRLGCYDDLVAKCIVYNGLSLHAADLNYSVIGISVN